MKKKVKKAHKGHQHKAVTTKDLWGKQNEEEEEEGREEHEIWMARKRFEEAKTRYEDAREKFGHGDIGEDEVLEYQRDYEEKEGDYIAMEKEFKRGEWEEKYWDEEEDGGEWEGEEE